MTAELCSLGALRGYALERFATNLTGMYCPGAWLVSVLALDVTGEDSVFPAQQSPAPLWPVSPSGLRRPEAASKITTG